MPVGVSGSSRLASAIVSPVLMLVLGLTGCGKNGNQSTTAGGSGATQTQVADYQPDPDNGLEVFKQGCITCHGAGGKGLPHQGPSLRTSTFVAGHSDKELIAFIKAGRAKNDPTNRSGNPMPPYGNIPGLIDERIADVVSYVRQLQREAKENGETATATTAPSAASVSTLK
jgi:mono/diheme cytochrome c family protein